MVQSIGLYAWGGPGTIRLLKVKYHSPHIDEASYLRLYEPDTLAAARQKLGVTDMWVTYSWGFADDTERQDRRYIVERLPGFQQQGIHTHAYIQGLNVVTGEFAGQDIFCRDAHGHLLPYSKGRALTCPNNPQARAIILDRVGAACREDFSGIFIDNILFGLPPFFVRRDYTSFFGCSCRHCRASFRAQYGYALPPDSKTGEQQITDYLDFRRRSVLSLLEEAAGICHAAHKRFGVNLYDPISHTPEVYFGYRLADLVPLLDYYLVENHALGKPGGLDNTHLRPLIAADKPVFVVSYRHGIGQEAAYRPSDLDAIWSEAAALGYAPCLKATEYTTRGIWHTLDLETVRPPVTTSSALPAGPRQPRRLKRSTPLERHLIRLLDRRYARLATTAFENGPLARLLARSGIGTRLLHADRNPRFSG